MSFITRAFDKLAPKIVDKIEKKIDNYEFYNSNKKKTYEKKEYFSGHPTEGLFASLPTINPRVLVGGNGHTGLVDMELITGTGSNSDPRGEPDSVKQIQSVNVPGFLINDRILTAAQQRAFNRDLTGIRQMQI